MSEEYKTYYRSPIGTLEIVGSVEGISAIAFVDDVQPSTRIPACLAECIHQLDEYFQGIRKEFSIQLDLRGSNFQKRVWRELLNIPFGVTKSYLNVANALGDKKAIRAVGRANGQNPIVIVVPCHRVIGSDGSLTGYGGGLWRKEWLLNFEGGRLQPSFLDPRQLVSDAHRR
jgi:methylated-DNA-[protein]-cysteine S-methyltransferase